jgi:hypothetical protein
MTSTNAALPPIPVFDLGAEGPLRLAREDAPGARALRDDCLAFFPPGASLLMPVADAVTRAWVSRSASPYVAEIAAIAATLGFSGVWMLNGSYQWGCTTIGRQERGAQWLARTLDWPFPGLGRHVRVARIVAQAGPYLTTTWPGFVGVLTAMAPGRFAAAINQAPLRRRTSAALLRPFDLAANALATWSIRHMPPDHLLRRVFETCTTYAAARTMLETTPVARPVLFTLVGCAPGEACVIERTEEAFVTRTDDTAVANDWVPPRASWEARIPAYVLLTRSFEEASEMNVARHRQIVDCASVSENFDWVVPPVLNLYTRLAVAASPAEGRLTVQGFESPAEGGLPRPVTAIRELREDHAAAGEGVASAGGRQS